MGTNERGQRSRGTVRTCRKIREISSRPAVPEGVPHSVFEADEAVPVLGHEVARVEVGVSLPEDVSHQLLLGQLLASSVAKERTQGAHLGQ